MSRPDILTYTGSYFNLLEPEQNIYNIEDIAHALAHICRFTGHTKGFYSVAQHCVHVARLVPTQHALAGLLHDASEAYLGDVSRPLKQLLPDYKAIERRVERAIARAFGLPEELPASVKHADLVMLATEQRDLMPDHDDEWACLAGIAPMPKKLMPLPPPEAKAAFLVEFRVLACVRRV
jgi:hypothetical protein